MEDDSIFTFVFETLIKIRFVNHNNKLLVVVVKLKLRNENKLRE